MTKTITIDAHYAPDGKKPGCIVADDHRYKYWPAGKGSATGLEYIQTGATVEIEYSTTQRGEYTDDIISRISPTNATSSVPASMSPCVDRKQAWIVNQSSIKAAIEFGAKDLDEAIRNAERISTWVFTFNPTATQSHSDDFDPFAD